MNVNLREAFPIIASYALCRPQLSVSDFSFSSYIKTKLFLKLRCEVAYSFLGKRSQAMQVIAGHFQ